LSARGVRRATAAGGERDAAARQGDDRQRCRDEKIQLPPRTP